MVYGEIDITNREPPTTETVHSERFVQSLRGVIEGAFGLLEGSVRPVNPDKRNASSEKLVGTSLKDWSW